MANKKTKKKPVGRPPLPIIKMADGKEKIGITEFAKRMERNVSDVKAWEARGYVIRDTDGRYLWPDCRDQVNARRRSHMSAKDLRPKARVTKEQKNKELDKENRPETGADAPVAKPPINISRKDLRSAELVQYLIDALERMEGTALSGTYQFAKTFEQLLKVEKAQTKLLAERGELIERRSVEETLEAAQRHKRNVWMNTPERIAVEFAEEAGIDRRLAYDLLTKHIQATLQLTADGAAEAIAAAPQSDKESDVDDVPLVSQDLDEEFEEDGGHDE